MIYLVEDDENIRELVTYTLNNSNLETEGFGLPSQFWAALEQGGKPSLIMLDIMLPEEDGLSILKKLRSSPATKKIPIMMVTAKGSEYDKVIGLDNGADDYIAKPFGMMELIARVKALLRRTGKEETETEYTIGCLYVSPAKHIVQVDGKDVTLTYTELR